MTVKKSDVCCAYSYMGGSHLMKDTWGASLHPFIPRSSSYLGTPCIYVYRHTMEVYITCERNLLYMGL